MIELTKTQQDFLPAAMWLLDRHCRGEGRTALMACTFIQLAIKYPGETITTFDHCPTQRCTREILMKEVRVLLKERPGFEFGSDWICFNPSKENSHGS